MAEEGREDEPKKPATDDDVAQWMFEEFNRKNSLDQGHAVHCITKQFGESFIYRNSEGGRSISKSVLRRFRKLTEGLAVWDRSEKYWLRKQNYHKGRLTE